MENRIISRMKKISAESKIKLFPNGIEDAPSEEAVIQIIDNMMDYDDKNNEVIDFVSPTNGEPVEREVNIKKAEYSASVNVKDIMDKFDCDQYNADQIGEALADALKNNIEEILTENYVTKGDSIIDNLDYGYNPSNGWIYYQLNVTPG